MTLELRWDLEVDPKYNQIKQPTEMVTNKDPVADSTKKRATQEKVKTSPSQIVLKMTGKRDRGSSKMRTMAKGCTSIRRMRTINRLPRFHLLMILKKRSHKIRNWRRSADCLTRRRIPRT